MARSLAGRRLGGVLLLLLLALGISTQTSAFGFNDPNADNPNEPPEMTRELWCAACHAAFREAVKGMPPPHLIDEGDVYDAFSGLDNDPFRFSAYSFSPPTMRHAVGRFVDEFEDVIDPRGAWPDGSSVEEAFLALHGRKIEPESAICEALCKGVKYLDPEAREEEIRELQRDHKRMLAKRRKEEAISLDTLDKGDEEADGGDDAGASGPAEGEEGGTAGPAGQGTATGRRGYAATSVGADAKGAGTKAKVTGKLSDSKSDGLSRSPEELKTRVERQIKAEAELQQWLDRSQSLREQAAELQKQRREPRMDL